MDYDNENDYYIATSKEDFRYWKFISKRKLKEGTYMVIIKTNTQLGSDALVKVIREVYTKKEYLPKVVNGLCI